MNSTRKRLAIVSSHPIQYNAPLFRCLTQSDTIEPKVFYTRSEFRDGVHDSEFRQKIVWDIPLLDGYDYTWVENTASNPKHGFFGVRNPSLIDRIEEFAPDAVLVYGWDYQSHFQLMRHFKGKIPVLFRGDSHMLDRGSACRRLLRSLVLTYIYRHVDYALYVGSNNYDYFRAFGLREDQLILLRHAVENSRFADSPDHDYERKALDLRRELGFGDHDPVIVYAGKFSVRKQVVPLLRTFLSAARPEWNLKLLLVGDGEERATLEQLAEGSDSVRFMPFQNQQQMPVVYRIGDVTILPSSQETWGLVLNEAMACGRAVIASDKVGCAQDLINSRTGWVFPDGDWEALSAILGSLSISKSRAIGRNNISFIQNWSYAQNREALEQLLARIENRE